MYINFRKKVISTWKESKVKKFDEKGTFGEKM
jgi:hypothetical protein